MPRLHTITLGAGLALLLAVACARNPVTGRPEVVLVSTAEEIAVGRQEAAKVAAQMGFADHEGLRAYVREIGARLAAHSPRQDVAYTFDVVDQPVPNAFALPGGPVYVSRGLLALANSEDQIAGVVAHEIAHIAGRHVVSRVTLATPFAIVVGIPAAIVGSVSRTLGAVIAAPGALAGGLVLASHSRSQERQADAVGMEMVAGAGWDPGALATILETLEREATLERGEQRVAGFFDSHPSTEDRLKRIERAAPAMARAPRRPVASDRTALLARLEGLLLGENPANGLFDDHRFLHPNLGFAIDFPESWSTRNQPRYVVAVAPEEVGEAFVLLQMVVESDNPLDGARKDRVEEALLRQLEPEHIHGLPAARIATESGGTAFDLTWIAHGGIVYRVAGATRTDGASHRARLENTARSFRPISDAERARVRESRLRLVEVGAGESLPDVLARAESDWDVARAALANGLAGETATPAPGPLKVSVPRPYVPATSAQPSQ